MFRRERGSLLLTGQQIEDQECVFLDESEEDAERGFLLAREVLRSVRGSRRGSLEA